MVKLSVYNFSKVHVLPMHINQWYGLVTPAWLCFNDLCDIVRYCYNTAIDKIINKNSFYTNLNWLKDYYDTDM